MGTPLAPRVRRGVAAERSRGGGAEVAAEPSFPHRGGKRRERERERAFATEKTTSGGRQSGGRNRPGEPRGTPGPGEREERRDRGNREERQDRGNREEHRRVPPRPIATTRSSTTGSCSAFSSPGAAAGPSRRRGVPAPPGSSYRPPFDLPGMHAFNATVFACAMVYASLAPALPRPGRRVLRRAIPRAQTQSPRAASQRGVAGASEGEGSDLFGSGRGDVGGGGGRGGGDALGDHSECSRREFRNRSRQRVLPTPKRSRRNAWLVSGSVPSRRTSDGRLVEAVARRFAPPRGYTRRYPRVSEPTRTRAQSACAAATLVVAVGWTRAARALRRGRPRPSAEETRRSGRVVRRA